MAGKAGMNHKRYLDSDAWKCGSPTGAHHWVQMVQTKKLAKEGYFQCRYCKDVKRFPIHWYNIDPSGNYYRGKIL